MKRVRMQTADRIGLQNKEVKKIALLYLLVNLALLDLLVFSYYGRSILAISNYGLSTFFMLFIVGWFCLVIVKEGKVSFLFFLSLAFVVYEIVVTIVNEAYSLTEIPFRVIEMLCWLAVFFLSFYYSKRIKTDCIQYLIKMALPFLVIFVAFFWIIYTDTSVNVWGLYNAVYFPLFFFPYLTSLENKGGKYILMILVFSCLVVSYKRTALLLFLVAIIYYFGATMGNRMSMAKKMGLILAAGLALGAAFYLFGWLQNSYQLDWYARILDAKETGGSNRFFIWEQMLEAFKRQSLGEWLFGHGYRTTGIFGGAHNDILEILWDYGVIGLGLYAAFVGALLKIRKRMKRSHYEYMIPFTVSLIYFGIYSLAGQLFIMPQWFLILCMFWGILTGNYYRKESTIVC